MLPASDALRIVHSKIDRHRETFSYIEKLCSKSIVRAVNSGMMSCSYEIPEFILGKPCFNITDCVRHLIGVLHDYGYEVNLYPPRVLLITWNKQTPKIIPRFSLSLH